MWYNNSVACGLIYLIIHLSLAQVGFKKERIPNDVYDLLVVS